MAFELKDGQGTLHRVLDKKGNEQRPDYHGELNIGGKVWKLAGWIKLSPRGKWLSLRAEEPRAALESRSPVSASPPPPRQATIDPESDIPF